MSIEALKEQARRHEQKEEWQKALDQYKKAIAKLDEDDQPDIGLYNRVGDLYVRVGKLDLAVEHYEQAVDLYMEAELPNNAIAVLKKVIRNVPERHEAFLRMGQVRASQGFLPDARSNFLTYAERMQQAGDLDESFRALVEFCDLAPDDVALRRVVADQMASRDRTGDAVDQLSVAYRSLMLRGEADTAAEVEARIRELDPDADLTASSAAAARVPGGVTDEGVSGDFGEIEFGSAHAGPPETEEAEVSGVEVNGFAISNAAHETEEAEVEEEAVPLPTFDLGEEEEEAAPLPTFDLGEEEEAEAAPLPTFDLGEEEGEQEEETVGADLPLLDFGGEESAPQPEETVLDAAAFGESDKGERETREYVEGGEMKEIDVGLDAESAEAVEAAMEEARADEQSAGAPQTLDEVRARLSSSPDDIGLHQRFVEMAYQTGEESTLVDAYMALGQALRRAGQTTRSKAAFQQVLQLAPDHREAQAALGAAPAPAQPVKEVASHEDYVDLGSLVLGDEGEKTTRFVVAYQEPSGDEAADFAKMLSQFKEKVSQNLDADDVKAHSDLGTAYMEMGLLDEAVSEFQQALRSSSTHLPTYELLGQTFMEMGRFDAAVRTLERALEVPFEVEDELLGIYYYLARAYEAVGNKESAVEFYDRVFTLDINFADVTERLRVLR